MICAAFDSRACNRDPGRASTPIGTRAAISRQRSAAPASNGERITIARGIGRYFAAMLSGLILCIGYLMAAFTERKQSLHDMICDTLVVDKWAFTDHPEWQQRGLGTVTIVILALFGLVAGQAVVWYSGQFYALFFLTQQLKVDGATANIFVAISLLIGTPFFVLFGSLSDKIGRKPIILAGCLLAALTYFPVFTALTKAANPALHEAQTKNQVFVVADPNECSFQFNPTGTVKFTSSCDIAKQVLAASSVSYDNQVAAAGTPATIKIGDTVITSYSSKGLPADEAKKKDAEFKKAVADALKAGKLLGAAVDVFPIEPKKTGDEFLTDLADEDNMILTPHIGGSTLEAQKSIGQFVSQRLEDYWFKGSTMLSVNLPQITLSDIKSNFRIAHLHANLPGVLARVNRVLGEDGINIAAQALGTEGEIGYVVTDVAQRPDQRALDQLASIEGTIRMRVIS